MSISPQLAVAKGLEVATVAGGCFWGMEHVFKKYFNQTTGLIDCVVGYTNGNITNPTYRDVCNGTASHAEAVQILYDPSIISYSRIIEFFLRIHDPTRLAQQGPDTGTQYRSGIYTHSEQQQKEAEAVVSRVQKLYEGKIVTEILPIQDWWDAEEYHQKYLSKNPGGYECPTHYLRGNFGEWIVS